MPALLDDDTYRDFLEGLTSLRSSKDLTDAQARRVLAELSRLTSGAPQVPPSTPKTGLVNRLLREAFTAGWDVPVESGAFDSSLDARRARVRARVLADLQSRCQVQPQPKRLEDWPTDALNACLEHLKGVARRARRKK